MNNKKKIIHFVSTLSKSSGVMSVIMNYYRHLDRDKIQFEFIYFQEAKSNHIDEIENLGGEVHFVTSPKNMFKFKKDVINVLDNYSYDLLHNHEVYMTMLLKKLVTKSKIRIITHSHSTKLSDKRISRIRNTILCKNITKYSDFNIACSKQAGKVLFKNNQFKVLYNSVDSVKFKFNDEIRYKIRKSLNISNEKLVGNIGRYANQKNQLFLIDIFIELIKIEKNVKLIIIGEGPLEYDLKEKVSNNNISDRVIILPFQDNIHEYYQALDLFILPSLYEGLPVVGVEAQYSGVPCVFSDSITEEVGVINSKFISLQESPFEWAKKINNVLKNETNRNDVNVINQMNSSGFNILKSVNDLEKIYLEL